MRKHNLAGISLIVLGLIMMTTGAIMTVPQATVTIDTEPPLIYSVVPSGTYDEPTPMTFGAYFEFGIWVTGVGGLATHPAYLEIYREDTIVDSFYLPYAGHTGIIDGYVWGKYEKYDWKVPTDGGVLFKFHFIVTDKADNVATVDRYGLTGTPDGYFEINDIKVSTDTHLYLNTRTLTFDFIATESPNEISKVIVEIYEGDVSITDLNLVKDSDTEWSGVYTFTKDGEFTVNGYIIPTYNVNQRYCKMSIVMNTGSEAIYVDISTVMLIMGVVMVTIGAVIMLNERKVRRR